MILTSNVPKKEIQFFFRLSLNAMRRFWCNPDTELFLALYSITVNLYSKFFCISICAFVLCSHKVFHIIAITFPVHQRHSRIKLRDHQLLCRLHSFCFWFPRGKKKEIDNSRKFLDLHGNILMSVLLKLLYILIFYFNRRRAN